MMMTEFSSSFQEKNHQADALFSLSFFSVKTFYVGGNRPLKSIRMGIAFLMALTSQQKLTSHANNWGSVHDVFVWSEI